MRLSHRGPVAPASPADYSSPMAKKGQHPPASTNPPSPIPRAGKPSALVDTRVVYCGHNLEQLQKLPDACIDLIYIDPPFNSNRNYEVSWGETKEKRAFNDRHASRQAYIDYMRPRCARLTRCARTLSDREKPLWK
jgi:hypothetical protein